MLRESPVALFIGDEVVSIRRYFAPVSAAHEGTGTAEAQESDEAAEEEEK